MSNFCWWTCRMLSLTEQGREQSCLERKVQSFSLLTPFTERRYFCPWQTKCCTVNGKEELSRGQRDSSTEWTTKCLSSSRASQRESTKQDSYQNFNNANEMVVGKRKGKQRARSVLVAWSFLKCCFNLSMAKHLYTVLSFKSCTCAIQIHYPSHQEQTVKKQKQSLNKDIKLNSSLPKKFKFAIFNINFDQTETMRDWA